jgi:hypothetical protein
MDRINTTTAAGKKTTSSAGGNRSAGSVYTQAEGPHKALVEDGATEPKKTTKPDDCKFRRVDVDGDVG